MPRPKKFEKEEVLKKAVDLFWEQGFHATSMDNLVTSLGINRASMYNTFGSKQGLFQAAIQQYKSESTKKIEKYFSKQENVRQGFGQYFTNLIESSTSDKIRKGCFVVNTTTELANSSQEIEIELDSNKVQFENIFKAFLQKGVEMGQISPYKDLEKIAAYFYTFQSGIQVMTKLSSTKEELIQQVQMALKVLD